MFQIPRWVCLACSLCILGPVSQVHGQSLFDAQQFKPLVADHRALRVGDVLTVQVVESAVANANADTGTSRRNQLGVDLSVAIPSLRNRSGALNVNGEFDGGGRTERAGRLVAQLTVTVRDQLANGDLQISGEQQLTINNETQRIKLVGRVRPQDISDGNVVLSSRVADAEITYVGDGHIADRQKPAWWRQAADWLGL